jgi:hypothetical protein
MRPVNEIRDLVNGRRNSDIPKYRLFSAHDDNIANILTFINPSYDFKFIPYAANIYFELWRIHEDGDFKIRTMYNGSPLILENCRTDGEFCSPENFFRQMNEVFFHGDLKEACAASPDDSIKFLN